MEKVMLFLARGCGSGLLHPARTNRHRMSTAVNHLFIFSQILFRADFASEVYLSISITI